MSKRFKKSLGTWFICLACYNFIVNMVMALDLWQSSTHVKLNVSVPVININTSVRYMGVLQICIPCLL